MRYLSEFFGDIPGVLVWVGQKAGFFKKPRWAGVFGVLLGFIGFYWAFLGFFGFF